MQKQITVFDNLEPGGLWTHFAAITAIPRASKHEQKIADYVLNWAKLHGFVSHQDAAGNVVVQVPATLGREGTDVIVLQSHLDIVCERVSGSGYDADSGNILVERHDDWIVAPFTTLGADNGVGVAIMLWVAEVGIEHGPLDLVFTTDEETGMTGVAGLDIALVRGRTVFNLDSEEDGTLCVGCAGGANTLMIWSAPHQAIPAGWRGTTLTVRGFPGGHSGTEIHKNRVNAIKALARLLQAASGPVVLSSIGGGNKSNAIPREASATVFHPPEHASAVVEGVKHAFELLTRDEEGLERKSVLIIDDEVKVSVDSKGFSEAHTRQILDLLRAVPSGVLEMSSELPGLVQSSTNLAVVTTSGSEEESATNQARVEILSSSRSSVAASLDDVLDSLQATARLAGAAVKRSGRYPGWKPNMNSRVLEITRKEYRRLFGSEPLVGAVHAGLECGLLGEKTQMDMISIGPTIVGAHAPGERVSITSVGKFCRLLVAVLDTLSK